MVDMVIQTNRLTKYYGKQRGIVGVNLEVQRGEVFGFLGPNGAGKTTTIRTLLDFIRPTSGTATVLGLDSREFSREQRRRIGYLQGELALYENMTGAEFLRYLANLRGGVDWDYVESLAARLQANLRQPMRNLSLGNKHKFGLIQALMHKPELLFLDEPTSGLDPLIQQEFYAMVGEVRAEGRTMFLSSHNLPEVERICDRVGIIREGRMVTVEQVAELKQRSLRRLEIRFGQTVPEQALAAVPGLHDLQVNNGIVYCTVVGSMDALIKALAGFQVESLISHEPSLEEIFLAYYNGTAQVSRDE